MLKVATIEDFDIVKSLANKFINVSGYKDLSDDITIDTLIRNILTTDNTKSIIILYGTVGMLAGAVSQFPFGTKMVATEIAWWVEPEARKSGAGKELLKAFEYWAKEKTEAETIIMVSLDDKLGEFYVREGYKLYERAYMKDV